MVSAQSPFALRQMMAAAFDIKESDIEVHIPYVGGAFGGKPASTRAVGHLVVESCRWSSRQLRMTRERNSVHANTRRHARQDQVGCNEGRPDHCNRNRVRLGQRAYADYGVNVGKTAVYGGLGPYDIPNASIVSNTIYTNKVFSTAYRGFGHLETLWTVERQTDILSQKLGIDPYEFRMMNLLKPGSKTITEETITESSGSPCDCLSAVVKEIGWIGRKTQEEREKEWKTGKVRGKGFAMIQKAPAMPANTATSVIMQMAGDGHVNIMMGAVDYGQGALTALAQIAAQELDIPFDMVKVIPQTNTETNPYDWNTVASKLTFMAGNAVIQASRNMVAQLKDVAARACAAHPTCWRMLTVTFTKAHAGNPYCLQGHGTRLCLSGRHGIGGPIISHGVCMADGLTNLDPKSGKGFPALAWTFGAHAVEIELDVESGNIDILKVASAFDIGQVINERMVYSQVVGGAMQGIGSAILEGYKFSPDNVLLNPRSPITRSRR